VAPHQLAVQQSTSSDAHDMPIAVLGIGGTTRYWLLGYMHANSIIDDGIGLRISAVHMRELPMQFQLGPIDELICGQLIGLISLHTFSSSYTISPSSP